MKNIRSVYHDSQTEKRTIEEIGRMLSLIYRRQYEQIGDGLKKTGLTALHSVVLVNIYRHPGLNQNELAELISIEKATVSRILMSLEPQKLIERQPDETDRRYNKLYVTRLGEEKVKESLDIQIHIWTVALAAMPQPDREELRARLAQLGECFGFARRDKEE